LTIAHANRLEFDRALGWGEGGLCGCHAGQHGWGLGPGRGRSEAGRRRPGRLRCSGEADQRAQAHAGSAGRSLVPQVHPRRRVGRGRGPGPVAQANDRLAEALAINDRWAIASTAPTSSPCGCGWNGAGARTGWLCVSDRRQIMLAEEHPKGMCQAWAEANLGALYLELGSLSPPSPTWNGAGMRRLERAWPRSTCGAAGILTGATGSTWTSGGRRSGCGRRHTSSARSRAARAGMVGRDGRLRRVARAHRRGANGSEPRI
jgi:hypothetical protein